MKSKLATRSSSSSIPAVLISVGLLFGVVQAARSESGIIEEVSIGATVDSCVQDAMSQFDIPGMAVAVVIDGEIGYERGYGVKHRDQGGAVDEHTLFRHGSVSKMFTAAAVLRLVDQGVVDLNEPVTEYVPELHFLPGRWSATQMRVRNLIDNTGSIPSLFAAQTMMRRPA